MGRAQAMLFAREGARVVVADIAKQGDEVAAEIGEAATFFHHDVGSEESWARIVAFTAEKFGAPTILVNTAGIVYDTTFIGDTSVELFERMYRVNQLGVFLGIRAVTATMQETGGSIVNVASAAALISAPGLSAYSSAKGAVRSLSRTAAKELGEFGVRVNTIFPGAIKTPILTPSQTKLAEEYVGPRTPLRRMGEAEEIATATLFLASDDASYITGAELVVDGGFLA